MDTLTYGFMISVVGMGGTLLGLCLLILIIHILKRLYPYHETDDECDRKAS